MFIVDVLYLDPLRLQLQLNNPALKDLYHVLYPLINIKYFIIKKVKNNILS